MSLEDKMDGTTPGATKPGVPLDNVPHETLPPVEEYLPEYEHENKCVKCEEPGAYTVLCSGKPRWFRRTCKHGLRGEHHVRTCKRCGNVWNEACLDGKPRGGLKLEMVNDLWVIVRLTYPDKGETKEGLKKRLEDIRLLAQTLNGYVNIL